MALTFTTRIDKALRSWKLGGGLQLKQVDMTSSDVSVDYAGGGYPLRANANKIGFRSIVDVLAVSISNGGTLRHLIPSYDHVTGRLRFAESPGAVGAFDEADVDAELIDGDLYRMTIIGI